MNLNATNHMANIDANKVCINHKTVILGNYITTNVVYLMNCVKCSIAQYIVETGGNIRYRFNNHTHTIRQKKVFPLTSHFNVDKQNIKDVKVCILKHSLKTLGN